MANWLSEEQKKKQLAQILERSKLIPQTKHYYFDKVPSGECTSYADYRSKVGTWMDTKSWAEPDDNVFRPQGRDRSFYDDCLDGVIWSIVHRVGKSPQELTEEMIIQHWPDLRPLVRDSLPVASYPSEGGGGVSTTVCRCKKGPCKYCACAKHNVPCNADCHAGLENHSCSRPQQTADPGQEDVEVCGSIVCPHKTGPQHDAELELSLCSGCLQEYYCSKKCQTAHWPEHRAYCSSIQSRKRQAQAQARACRSEVPPRQSYDKTRYRFDDHQHPHPPFVPLHDPLHTPNQHQHHHQQDHDHGHRNGHNQHHPQGPINHIPSQHQQQQQHHLPQHQGHHHHHHQYQQHQPYQEFPETPFASQTDQLPLQTHNLSTPQTQPLPNQQSQAPLHVPQPPQHPQHLPQQQQHQHLPQPQQQQQQPQQTAQPPGKRESENEQDEPRAKRPRK